MGYILKVILACIPCFACRALNPPKFEKMKTRKVFFLNSDAYIVRLGQVKDTFGPKG